MILDFADCFLGGLPGFQILRGTLASFLALEMSQVKYPETEGETRDLN